MSDLISRQAAIDYFVTNVGFHDEDGYPIEDECELREIWTGYFDGILSAQPEISMEQIKIWLDAWEGYVDKDIIARMKYRVIDIPLVQTREETT